jgi:hypothetical protein
MIEGRAIYGNLENNTDRHDITEILLKVALNTIKQTNKQTNKQFITSIH